MGPKLCAVETSRPDGPATASDRDLQDVIARMASHQAQLGNQLSATMAALGTLTTAVARQNTTIASLMEEVRRLREQGATGPRRAAH